MSALGSTLGFGDTRDDSLAGSARPASARGPASLVVTVSRPERTKIECPFCGYKCFPQWLNNQAHCLKCNNVVMAHPPIQSKEFAVIAAESAVSVATGLSKRVPGEACTDKFWTPGSAMESSSEGCQASPDGLHHWRFGKCTYCQMGEGDALRGGSAPRGGSPKAGATRSPGSKASCAPGGKGPCASGGKCIYKFAKCTKCGKSEY